jgi:hypothetical protein
MKSQRRLMDWKSFAAGVVITLLVAFFVWSIQRPFRTTVPPPGHPALFTRYFVFEQDSAEMPSGPVLWVGSIDVDREGKPLRLNGPRQEMVRVARMILSVVHEK